MPSICTRSYSSVRSISSSLRANSGEASRCARSGWREARRAAIRPTGWVAWHPHHLDAAANGVDGLSGAFAGPGEAEQVDGVRLRGLPDERPVADLGALIGRVGQLGCEEEDLQASALPFHKPPGREGGLPPGEARGLHRAEPSQFVAVLLVLEDAGERARPALDIEGVDQQAGITGDLGQRRVASDHHRDAARHRLQRGSPKPSYKEG